MILFKIYLSTASFDGSNLSIPPFFHKYHITSITERYWDTVVAIATPATLILNTITRIIFRITFRTPAAVRKYSGLLVSPTALSIAAQKL